MENVHEVLQRGQELIKMIPEDMKMSIGLGLALSGTFLIFANKEQPLLDIQGRDEPSDYAPSKEEVQDFNEQFDRIGKAAKKMLAKQKKQAAKEALIADGNVNGSNDNANDANNNSEKKNKNNKKKENKKKEDDDDDDDPLVGLDVDEIAVVKRLVDIKDQYKLNDATIEEAITKTKSDFRRGIRSTMDQDLDDGPMSWFKAFDWLILLILLFIGAALINEKSEGDAGRIITALLPREMKAIGVYDFLMTYGARGHPATDAIATIDA
jgi:hypothetical protein